MTRDHLEKAFFVLSLAVLAFLYGFATRTFNWPPSSFLDRAWLQARAAASSGQPDYVSSRVYERDGARTVDRERMEPGLTLVATTWEDDDWNPGLRLIDAAGRVLHEWRVEPTELFPDTAHRRTTPLKEQDVQGSHLFPDGDVLVNVEYAGTARLDACGDVRWTLPAGSHHSIARADDGSFWIPGLEGGEGGTVERRAGEYPGLSRSVAVDQLLRVSGDGELLEAIDLLGLLYASDLERYIFRAGEQDSSDPTHLNDIEPLPDSMEAEYPNFDAGDLLLSLRNLDLVLVVDPGSGRVRWHASDSFIAQHDPDFTGDGWIGVFDNNVDGTERGSALGGSRILALQPHTDSTRVLFPAARSDPFYTSLRGKWQRLGNGNLLLTESAAGRVVEVGPDGATVWEWIAEPYDESAVPWVSEGTRYRLTPEDVDAWPCSPDGVEDGREEAPESR